MKKRLIRLLLLGILLFSAWRLISASTYQLESGQLKVVMTPAIPGGRVILPLGPVGELTWKLHWAPVDLRVEFLISEKAKNLPTAKQLASYKKNFIMVKSFWLIIFALSCCLLIYERGTKKRHQRIVVSIAAFLTLILAVGLIGVLTFNAAALKHPSYKGPVKDAQRVLQIIRESQSDWEGAQRSINSAIQNISQLSRAISEGSKGIKGDTVKFLLISDIHNNPSGLTIARDLADSWKADAILNAGDFTDRGTGLEAKILANFGNFKVPHIIVAGNHEDGPAISRAKLVPGVQFLEYGARDTAEIGGIKILGDADPNSERIEDNPRDEWSNSEFPRLCEQLKNRFIATNPQMIMAHNPAQGECARSYAEENGLPLVFIWGHKHQQALELGNTVTGISAGTSGAGGIKEIGKRPYGFAFIEFDRTTKKLVAGWLCENSSSNLSQTSCKTF